MISSCTPACSLYHSPQPPGGFLGSALSKVREADTRYSVVCFPAHALCFALCAASASPLVTPRFLKQDQLCFWLQRVRE